MTVAVTERSGFASDWLTSEWLIVTLRKMFALIDSWTKITVYLNFPYYIAELICVFPV